MSGKPSKITCQDYLMVEIESGVKIYYYLENDRLERIIKTFS